MTVQTSDDTYRKMAHDQWYQDGYLDIDENAVVSVSEDTEGVAGAWVAAWVFVDEPEADPDRFEE